MDAGIGVRSGPTRRQFGIFMLDHERGELSVGGRPVLLRPKTFALMAYLAERAGHPVSKQELLHALWPGLVVTDDSLSQAVSELRGAIGDREQKLIRTLPRRGYMFDPEIAAVGTQVPRWRARWPRFVLAAITGVVVLLGLFAWQTRGTAPDIGAELADRRSIAVMPFTDLSEPKAPHVAFAVDQALTTHLGRLGDIKVISRESSMALGTSDTVDPKRAGSKLGVQHLLTGSVRLDGARLAVSVRLLRTDSGALLWIDRFEYPSVADWTTQTDILARVANVLDMTVNKSALKQTVRSPLSPEAVDHWMRGTYLLTTLAKPEQLLEARRHFEAALAAQPGSVHALTGLASTQVSAVLFLWSEDPKQSLASAMALARQALEIDPDDQGALKALSGALMFAGDIDGSMSTTRRLLALNPNDAHSNRELAANLYFMGRFEEALRQVEVAERLNPLDTSNMAKLLGLATSALVALHRYDEAIERARRGMATSQPAMSPLLVLASAEAHRGDLAAARAHVAEVLKRDPGYFIDKRRSSRGSTAPAYLQGVEHINAGLRLAGMPDAPPVAAASAPTGR